jgi:hypothetical protein
MKKISEFSGVKKYSNEVDILKRELLLYVVLTACECPECNKLYDTIWYLQKGKFHDNYKDKW